MDKHLGRPCDTARIVAPAGRDGGGAGVAFPAAQRGGGAEERRGRGAINHSQFTIHNSQFPQCPRLRPVPPPRMGHSPCDRAGFGLFAVGRCQSARPDYGRDAGQRPIFNRLRTLSTRQPIPLPCGFPHPARQFATADRGRLAAGQPTLMAHAMAQCAHSAGHLRGHMVAHRAVRGGMDGRVVGGRAPPLPRLLHHMGSAHPAHRSVALAFADSGHMAHPVCPSQTTAVAAYRPPCRWHLPHPLPRLCHVPPPCGSDGKLLVIG